MHLLLRGYLPFDAKTEEKIRKRILTSKVTLDKPRWNEISSDAKDLLKQLLKKTPDERIDFQGVKNHSWFKNLDLLQQQRTRMASLAKDCPTSARNHFKFQQSEDTTL